MTTRGAQNGYIVDAVADGSAADLSCAYTTTKLPSLIDGCRVKAAWRW
jgi:hypothetical protein